MRVYDDYATSGATPHGTYTFDMIKANAGYTHGRVVLRNNANREYLEARAPRIEIMDDADEASWAIVKMVLEYQVLPGDRHEGEVQGETA
jgi:hypothetical protein